MGELSDEKLIKRSGHAGRNLAALALLTSVVAAGATAVCFFAREVAGLVACMAVSLSLVAAGYWLLAVAAKRGNIRAVDFVIGYMLVQIVLGMALNGYAVNAAGAPQRSAVAGMLLPVLVLLAVIGSRSSLAELERRGLWRQVFGAAKPSGHLCGLGAALLVLGALSFLGSSFYVGWRTARVPADGLRQARAYTEILNGEERLFLSAVDGLADGYRQEDLTAVQEKIGALENAVGKLRAEAAGNRELGPILLTYGDAVAAWKSGLDLLRADPPDAARARDAFDRGIRLRERAAQAFDAHFASRQSRPAAEL